MAYEWENDDEKQQCHHTFYKFVMGRTHWSDGKLKELQLFLLEILLDQYHRGANISKSNNKTLQQTLLHQKVLAQRYLL